MSSKDKLVTDALGKFIYNCLKGRNGQSTSQIVRNIQCKSIM